MEENLTAADRINLLIDRVKAQAADGYVVTFGYMTGLIAMAKELAVKKLMDSQLNGASKKELVLSVVARVFDNIAPLIPLPIYLQPFRYPLTQVARWFVLWAADGGIEAVYERLKAEQGEANA